MAGYGATPVAAFSLFGRQSGLLLAPAGGLSVTAPAMVGQNLGAGQPMRAARAVKLIAAATGVSGALLLGLLILFARPAYAAFTADAETISLGVQVIAVLALYRLLLLMSTVLDGALTGAGDTVSPMVVNFIAQFGVLLPAVWLLDRSGKALSLIHISEPTRLLSISYAVFCLHKKNARHRLLGPLALIELSAALIASGWRTAH